MIETSNTTNSEAVQQYRREGYLIIRQFFSNSVIARLEESANRLRRDDDQRISGRNLRCRFMPHYKTEEQLFECFDPIIDLATDFSDLAHSPPLLELLHEIYGEPGCLFKDKLIFKPPGSLGYQLHQDIPLSWEGFPRTFLSVLVPIDSCSVENGCTQVYSGYHKSHLCKDPNTYMLPNDLVEDSKRVDLVLSPGDIAVFHGLTPHRSSANLTNACRRTLYLSYNSISEGGYQRELHYEQFQQRMRAHLESELGPVVYFK